MTSALIAAVSQDKGSRILDQTLADGRRFVVRVIRKRSKLLLRKIVRAATVFIVVHAQW